MIDFTPLFKQYAYLEPIIEITERTPNRAIANIKQKESDGVVRKYTIVMANTIHTLSDLDIYKYIQEHFNKALIAKTLADLYPNPFSDENKASAEGDLEEITELEDALKVINEITGAEIDLTEDFEIELSKEYDILLDEEATLAQIADSILVAQAEIEQAQFTLDEAVEVIKKLSGMLKVVKEVEVKIPTLNDMQTMAFYAPEYRYFAEDEDGYQYAYKLPPIKTEASWQLKEFEYSDGYDDLVDIPNHRRLSHLSWEDEEAYEYKGGVWE